LQGWGTLRFFFDSEEATRTAKILGCAYLTHSAFFVTTDVVELHNGIRYFLIAFYMFMILFIALETRQSLRVIQRNEEFAVDQVIMDHFRDSFILKKRLLKQHGLISCAYCTGILLCLIFLHLSPRNSLYAQNLVIGSEEYNKKSLNLTFFYAAKECVEIFIVVLLLYTWRPRDWPHFFLLDVPNNPRVEGLFPNAGFFNLEPVQ